MRHPPKEVLLYRHRRVRLRFAQEVVLLQTFRDRHLCGNPLGETFIRAYYHFSPSLAGLIGQNEVLKLLTRYLLAPLILLIKKSAENSGSLGDSSDKKQNQKAELFNFIDSLDGKFSNVRRQADEAEIISKILAVA